MMFLLGMIVGVSLLLGAGGCTVMYLVFKESEAEMKMEDKKTFKDWL